MPDTFSTPFLDLDENLEFSACKEVWNHLIVTVFMTATPLFVLILLDKYLQRDRKRVIPSHPIPCPKCAYYSVLTAACAIASASLPLDLRKYTRTRSSGPSGTKKPRIQSDKPIPASRPYRKSDLRRNSPCRLVAEVPPAQARASARAPALPHTVITTAPPDAKCLDRARTRTVMPSGTSDHSSVPIFSRSGAPTV
jgi:hypothetical protein